MLIWSLILSHTDALAQARVHMHTPNDENKNFVNTHEKAVAECIPIKLRTRQRDIDS